MSEQEQRALVVKIAREWIGTRYQHGARIKRVCCDCTFPAKVYEEAGLTNEIKIAPYISTAHLTRASGQYLGYVRKIAHEIEADRIGPGDLMMFHIARDFSHSAIITEWPMVVHADLRAGAVLEAPANDGELKRATNVKFFSLW